MTEDPEQVPRHHATCKPESSTGSDVILDVSKPMEVTQTAETSKDTASDLRAVTKSDDIVTEKLGNNKKIYRRRKVPNERVKAGQPAHHVYRSLRAKRLWDACRENRFQLKVRKHLRPQVDISSSHSGALVLPRSLVNGKGTKKVIDIKPQTLINYPTSFISRLTFDSSSQLLQFMAQHGWAFSAIRRYWSFGYRMDPVVNIFNAIPDKLRIKIESFLEVLEAHVKSNTNRLSAAVDSEGHSEDVRAQEQFRVNRASMWEQDVVHGVVEVQYEPSTQRRTSVFVNSRAAHMMYMQKDELLSRFANHEIPLNVAEIDALRLFLVDVHCTFHDRTSFCYRRIITFNNRPEGQLVRCERVKIFTRTGQIAKVRDSVRTISPTEYDEALQHSPAQCPLALMGDMRSGKELLDDSESDSRETIHSLSLTEQGRRRLEELSACMDKLRPWLSDPLGEIPAPAGCPPTPSGAGAAPKCPAGGARFDAVVHVQRPIPFRTTDIRFDRSSAVVDMMVQRKWADSLVKRYCSIGFQQRRLVRIFDSLPPRLEAAIKEAFRLLEGVRQRLGRASSSLGCAFQDHCEVARARVANQIAEEEEAIWEEETSQGFLKLEFDPQTQVRSMASVNSFCARCFNLHREEMLARLAGHDCPLFETELDFVCEFIFRLLRDREDVTVLYARKIAHHGGAVRATLCCVTSRKDFTLEGQLYKSRHTLRVIEPAEYDEALRRRPAACTAAVFGDMRSGRQLLADAAADAQQTVASLAASHGGRRALDNLAAVLERGPLRALSAGLLPGQGR